MRNPLHQGEWIVSDEFGRRWRFWISSQGGAQATADSRHQDASDPLFSLLFSAFGSAMVHHDDVRNHDVAHGLLTIYDALTRRRIADTLPRVRGAVMHRLPLGLAREVAHELRWAHETGKLCVAPHEIPRWAPDVEQKPEEREPAPAKNEELKDVAFRVLRWEDHAPLADATVVISGPEGNRIERMTDKDGWVRVQGRPGETFKLVRVLEPGENHQLAMGTRSSSSGTA